MADAGEPGPGGLFAIPNPDRQLFYYEKRIPAVDPRKTVVETPVPDGIPPDKPWPLIID